jgi:carboxyl-terminal processing protease
MMNIISLRLFALSIILVLSFNLRAQRSQDWEISKNLDIYTSLLQQLNQHYVDDIQPGQLTKTAINAMLKGLDPYTIYYPEADIEDVRFMQTGKYGGIGSYVHIKNDSLYVGMPTPGFPFYKAGLRAGDLILKVDNVETTGKKMSEVSDMLRGPSGTKLSVLYRASKDKSQQTIEITREQIKVKNVPYYGKLNDSTAYIKLSGFTETAAKEVYEAINAMNKSKELKSLVLDLRFNGGGLLGQAVGILDLFVPENELIVSVKGKISSENADYKTRMPAVFPNLKVVVLVNNRSASASEIVAGSFQDLDRAVIMGQKSFGKGLVQKVYKLSYNSQVKITIAKYYIPSGRCIQALDYGHKDEKGHAVRTADSLQAIFKTKNGRPVKDGGGIVPDVTLENSKRAIIASALSSQYLIFDFATLYVNTHDSIKNPEDFIVSDELFQAFVTFVKKQNFKYKTGTDRFMEALDKQAKKEDYYERLKPEIEALQKTLETSKAQEIELHKDEIKDLLRVELVSRYYYLAGKVSSSLKTDKEVQAAVELLNNQQEYKAVLSGNKKQ